MPWDIQRDDGVAVVSMNSHRANAQNDVFFRDLHEAFDRLEREFTDCAVVLTSSASCFSAGLDFETVFPRIASKDLPSIAAFFATYRQTNLRIWRFPRPTIAAISGHAFAGGVITALDCDFRVCVDSARLSLNEVAIGIPMPAVYVEIIRHAVGTPAASVTTLFAREYRAEEARALGLVHQVTTKDRLLPEALAMARAIPPDAFDAYAFTKKALQAPALERIETVAAALDEHLPALLSAERNVKARARRYQTIMGRAPSWAPPEQPR